MCGFVRVMAASHPYYDWLCVKTCAPIRFGFLATRLRKDGKKIYRGINLPRMCVIKCTKVKTMVVVGWLPVQTGHR